MVFVNFVVKSKNKKILGSFFKKNQKLLERLHDAV
jgi:hypothetical protein